MQTHPGIYIRELREAIGLSQAKLSRFIGIKQVILSQWETRKETPTIDEVDLIAKTIYRIENEIKQGTLCINKKKSNGKNGHKILTPEVPSDLKVKRTPAVNEYLKSLRRLDKFVGDVVPQTENLRCISLFAGGGGMTLGAKAAGFTIKGFVELNEDARKTLKVNFPEAECLGADVCLITDEQINDWKQKFGSIDLLIGGPPCQGFSLAGKRDPKDKRNLLFYEYLRIAKKLEPKIIIMENVSVLTSMKNSKEEHVLSDILKEYSKIGYRCNYKELNARDYGVPQFRSRVFFIALSTKIFDEGISISFPLPTNGNSSEQDLFQHKLKPYFTFRDATKDLEPLESSVHSQTDSYHWAVTHPPHVIKWLRSVPEGESAHNNKDKNLRPPSGYNTTYKRIKWDEPCSTISTNFGMISGSRNVHPQYTRAFTVREATRCQSFPDNYQFVGTWGAIRTAIGNAVPPLLARQIVEHVKTYLS